jgi:cyclic beta-1,2-glucan synthetase
MPKSWPGFEIAFQHGSARYEITVENPDRVSHGVSRVVIDGEPLQPGQVQIDLSDDGVTHRVRVILGG